jgi:hypothetical protein
MKMEALRAGYYESPLGVNFPNIQLLTIKGLLEGTERAVYPDLMQGGLMFKRAAKEITEQPRRLPGTE